ncbi:MAG: minor capsid protein [Chloroflexi bacterium]|nr:minor capsid protein [Chloroflexota bacterium]
MSVEIVVHAAAVDRYRRILESGNADLLARKGQAERRGAETPRGVVLTGAQIDFMVERYADGLARRARRLTKAAGAPDPVGARPRDAQAYERAIRRGLLGPLMRNIRLGLSTAVAAAEAIERLDEVPLRTTRRDGLVAREIAKQARRLSGYQRRRLIQTFRDALGVDIRPVLDDAAIRPLMTAWRQENISLIRTVPTRLRDDLRAGINQAFADKPFDQQELARVVREKGKSAGWNLRRITRDQTNKAIGNLTQARHQQLGIEEYIWSTVGDERVRRAHAALEGTKHRWDEPPGEGHPGEAILCRCRARPVIPEAGVAS